MTMPLMNTRWAEKKIRTIGSVIVNAIAMM